MVETGAVWRKVEGDLAEKGVDEELIKHCAHIVQGSADDYEEGLVPALHSELEQALLPLLLRHLDRTSISELASSAIRTAEATASVGTSDGDLFVRCEGIILAFAGKVLLQKSRLLLHSARVHGVVGQNGCGKTTLMRRLRSKDIDNFPQHLSVVYVEDPSHAYGVSQWVSEFANPNDDEEVSKDALAKAGFTDAMRSQRIGELSGGWRMKAAIIRALQQTPSILLLDGVLHSVCFMLFYVCPVSHADDHNFFYFKKLCHPRRANKPPGLWLS